MYPTIELTKNFNYTLFLREQQSLHRLTRLVSVHLGTSSSFNLFPLCIHSRKRHVLLTVNMIVIAARLRPGLLLSDPPASILQFLPLLCLWCSFLLRPRLTATYLCPPRRCRRLFGLPWRAKGVFLCECDTHLIVDTRDTGVGFRSWIFTKTSFI